MASIVICVDYRRSDDKLVLCFVEEREIEDRETQQTEMHNILVLFTLTASH